MERKTDGTLMGGAGSKSQMSVTNPFPVDRTQSNDLDMLSYVAARILSTPDIYDINNLARPGVCGDYAVFLKKDLEKKLLPFIVEIDGMPTDVVYQHSRKAISKIEVRKKICSEMVDTLLRAIATIVACLASIQVASPTGSREAAIATVPKVQSGGSYSDVRAWLSRNGYISADNKAPAGTPMIIISKSQQPQECILKLTLIRTVERLTYARIDAEPVLGVRGADIEMGGLNIHFLDPIILPNNQNILVLPLQITDRYNYPVISGLLHESTFKSFKDTTAPLEIISYLQRMFKRARDGQAPPLIETLEDIRYADGIFTNLKRFNNPQILQGAIGAWIGTLAQQPYGVPQPYGAPPQPYGAPPQPYGAPPQPYGAPPQPYGAPQPYVARPYAPMPGMYHAPFGAQPIAFRPATGDDMAYDIPLEATKSIRDMLRKYREILPKESSPAAVRAKTLAGIINPDRTILTNVCRDPFWTNSRMSEIYSWATFQFLSVEKWSTLADRKNVTYKPEWKEFVNKLSQIYTGPGVPTLNRQSTSYSLEDMTFAKANEIMIGDKISCKDNQTPRVRFKEVQTGLAKLHDLYNAHTAKIWAILGGLIYVIEDPETKSKMVRLHPDVVRSTKTRSSKQYVDGKTEEARRALSDFYLQVETEYVNSIKTLLVA